MRVEREHFQSMRVLMIPGRRHAQNSYFPLLWDALQGAGLEMISARSTAGLTLRYDILHIHHPEILAERRISSALLVASLFLAYSLAARIAGKKLVWTIHEVDPARRYILTHPLLWCMRKLTNAYVFMNQSSEDGFFNRHPEERRKTVWRIPHSSYPVTKLSTPHREEVRAALTQGTDCLMIGFLGEIRPYKNPDALKYLPTANGAGRPVRLVTAGVFHATCDVKQTEAIFRAIQPDRLVRIEERLSDKRLSELIQAIDVIFLPYLRGWNSGLAMLALGCGARLLCSDLPLFREIEETLGRPWIYVFNHNAVDLSQELTTAVARVSNDNPNASDQLRLEEFLAARSFDFAALEYARLYSNLRSGSMPKTKG
jgi:beta-1,4-mannosyltransferase